MTRLLFTEMDFRFHFMTRLHWTLGVVHWNLVESIGQLCEKVEQEQNRVYHIDFKIDQHSTYLILDLYVEQEFLGSVNWYRETIQLFFTTCTEAKHTLVFFISFICK